MRTEDKNRVPVGGVGRPMIAPKNVVKITTESERTTVVTAARAVIKEHQDVIRALAKR